MSSTDRLMFIIACVFWAIVFGIMALGYVAARIMVRNAACNDIDDKVSRRRERVQPASIQRHA